MKRKHNPFFDWKSLSWKLGDSPKKLRKKKSERKGRESADRKLFRQLQADKRREERQLARAERWAAREGQAFDRKSWEDLLRQNPKKFRETLNMATKKRSRKKKGKMPAALAAYWRKKRAKKNPKGKAARRKMKSVRRRVLKRARKSGVIPGASKWFRKGYDAAIKKQNPKRKRRARKRSTPRPRKPMTIKAPSGLGPKGLKLFASAIRRASGLRTRIVKR
jgi:hypothetical protein